VADFPVLAAEGGPRGILLLMEVEIWPAERYEAIGGVNVGRRHELLWLWHEFAGYPVGVTAQVTA
jgi:hypothetical protein